MIKKVFSPRYNRDVWMFEARIAGRRRMKSGFATQKQAEAALYKLRWLCQRRRARGAAEITAEEIVGEAVAQQIAERVAPLEAEMENLRAASQRQSASAEPPQRARGRESGTLGFDHNRFMSDLKSNVMALSKTMPAWNITQKAVAERFQLNGEDIGADGVRKRLALCGVTQKWREFVETVI